MKGKKAPHPYNGYYWYGPIFHKNESRMMVVLYPIIKNGVLKRTSTSYSRFLMSIDLGRKLKRNEHVDHIDGNKLNDSKENLKLFFPMILHRKYKPSEIFASILKIKSEL